MVEYYGPDVLAQSRRLYEAIKSWAEPRGDITLIGGWSVYEHVAEARRMQSRDIDLIMHDRDALMAFDRRLPEWDLTWRKAGRNRFNDCHLRNDPSRTIVVDVFKDHAFDEPVFRGMQGRRGVAVKSAERNGFLPSLDFMVADKVRTIPLRQRERLSKQTKDLLDLHALVFHNLGGRDPWSLLSVVGLPARVRAAEVVNDAVAHRPQNEEELRQIEAWLTELDA